MAAILAVAAMTGTLLGARAYWRATWVRQRHELLAELDKSLRESGFRIPPMLRNHRFREKPNVVPWHTRGLLWLIGEPEVPVLHIPGRTLFELRPWQDDVARDRALFSEAELRSVCAQRDTPHVLSEHGEWMFFDCLVND